MIALNFTIFLEFSLFIIFLAGSYYLVWQPLLKTMDSRSGKIEGDKLAGEKSRKEAQRLESLYLHQLTEVHQESAGRLNQARYDAYQKGRSELDSLRQTADREVDEYREAVDRQIEEERQKVQPLLQELVEIADRRISAEGSLL